MLIEHFTCSLVWPSIEASSVQYSSFVVLMNYINHLQKINDLCGGGKLAFCRKVVFYNLRRIFQRPSLVRLTSAKRYRNKKKLIYTILTGGYDQLNEIPRKLPNWDYVCFTDNRALTSRTWRVCLLENTEGFDSVRLSRHYKINHHLVDQGYEISLYVDANLRIRGDLDSFLAQALPVNSDFAILQHPFLHSLSQELEKCIEEGKDDTEILQQQYHHYTNVMGFQDRLPHINARVMIRRSNRPELQRLMETWFAQLLTWSRRDQMAFNYALSNCPDVRPYYIPYWIFRNYFKRMDHR